MSPRPTLIALALAAAVGASTGLASTPSPDDRRSTWIVRFVEPSLASFDGTGVVAKRGEPALAATSPLVTGAARLDVDAPASQAYLQMLSVRREARLEAASARLGREIEPLFVYDAVLNGVALSLTADEAAAIATLPGVAGIERERIEQLQDDVSSAWVKAPEVWSGAAGVATRGEGVVVGIVDSGINPTHPAFAAVSPVDGFSHANPRGRFFGLCALGQATCNNKLIGIWDFTTGSGATEADTGIDLDGHGTHVAGTAVGNPVNITRAFPSGGQLQYQIRGVAPRANVISYKACEDDGCAGSWTLASLQQALRDGVDVINYSIGGQNVDPWNSAGARAMLDLRNAGIVVAVSAGNRGPDLSTVGSPSDAPWVMSVAAATHGRRFVNRLRLSGGATPPPLGGVIDGQGLTGGTGPAPLARDPQHPLCSQGSGDLTLPVTGASNPWPAGRWSGQIVLCDRGVQSRVAKSNNVRLAGGSGTVLLNTAADGESVVADEHSQPATHIGFTAAQAVLQWLANGSGHTASIDSTVVEVQSANADVLAGFSSRGPSIVLPGVIKPDLAAPGSSIQSASHNGNGDAPLSGTSMAAPHVAGAAALLRAARPTWRADQIISALMTTARPNISRAPGGGPMTPHEQGAGMIDVARAVRANLAFPMGVDEFANGAGAPAAMNLPSLVFDRCAPGCGTLSRTVADLIGGGSYTVAFSGPAGVTLTPSDTAFTLGAGASRTLQFTASINDPGLYGRWLYGTLTFTRQTSDEVRETRVPVALRATASGVPAAQTRTLASDRGFFEFTLPPLSLAMPNARYLGTRLVGVTRNEYALGADPTPTDRYDSLTNGGVGWHSLTAPVPANGRPTRYRIEVDLQTSGGTQTSLIVGNGASPGSRNQICESATRCVLEVEHPGTGAAQAYWAMVWNRSGNGTFTVTHSVLPLAPAEDADAARLVVTGPGSASTAQNSPLRVGFSDPTWQTGELRRGAVLVYAAPGAQPMAVLPFSLTRAGGEPAPVALSSGVARTIALPATGSHERIFIDVPAGATELRANTAAIGNVDLFVSRRPFVAAETPEAAAVPVVAPAPPRAEAVRRSTNAGGNEQIVIVDPAPGRWYITPVNATSLPIGNARVTATVTGAAPTIRPGGYFNFQRSGHGLFLYPAGTELAGLWYTYLQDGTTTWYYLQGPAPGANGLWRGTIFRSAWNGSANHLVPVGEGHVVPTSPDAFTWSYTLDGETGAEPFTSFGRGCPAIGGTTANVSGHWFDPARAGTGFSVQLFPNYEYYAVFVYDGRGVPRFLDAQFNGIEAPTATLPLDQLSGFCPLCPRSGNPTRTRIGTLERRYANGVLQSIGVSATFGSGVSGTWSSVDAVTPLGGLQGCAP